MYSVRIGRIVKEIVQFVRILRQVVEFANAQIGKVNVLPVMSADHSHIVPEEVELVTLSIRSENDAYDISPNLNELGDNNPLDALANNNEEYAAADPVALTETSDIYLYIGIAAAIVAVTIGGVVIYRRRTDYY